MTSPILVFEDITRKTGEQLPDMVRLREVRRKVAVSVRVDPRVLDWLKSKGGGHLHEPAPYREGRRRIH